MRLERASPGLPLGTYRTFWWPRTLWLSPELARTHMHVLGKTGSGKSYFLAGLFLALHAAGMPATLIDPHGDLAELVLAHLVQPATTPIRASTTGCSTWICRPRPGRTASCR